MRKIVAIIALFVGFVLPLEALAYTYSYAPTIPTTHTSTGVTTQPLNGVTGACLSFAPTTSGTPNPIFNLDCSGNLGVSGNFTSTSASFSGLTSGNCVQAGSGGTLTTVSSPCGSGGGGSVSPLIMEDGSNNLFNNPVSGYWDASSVQTDAYSYFPNHTVTGATISCMPYNATLAAASLNGYPYTVQTVVRGGTLQFVNVTNSTLPYTSVGTLVMPNCTTSGACTTTVTASFTPFVTTPGTFIGFYNTVSSGGGEPYVYCIVTLQGN